MTNIEYILNTRGFHPLRHLCRGQAVANWGMFSMTTSGIDSWSGFKFPMSNEGMKHLFVKDEIGVSKLPATWKIKV